VERAASLLVAACLLVVAAGLVARRGEAAAAPSRPCAALAATDADLSEGPPSVRDAAINLKSRGVLRTAVIFVDFSDAPGSEAPAAIASRWVDPGVKWLRTSSYGRFGIVLQPATRWVRMPHPAASYGYARTYDTHREYIGDAIAAADRTFDFSRIDIVYVVAAKTNANVIPDSPTFRAELGTFVADGRKLGPAVTFGFDAYTDGRTILPHETGHLLGLPDLYAFSGADIHRFVGTWDLMGNVFMATDLFTWHRLKLGWLDPAQVICASRGRSTTAELRPLGAVGGKKAVFVRTGSTTGVLVENRQRVGNDSSICDSGVLVYAVNSSIHSGSGPIKVIGGSTAGCGFGPRSDAPLHAGESVRVGSVQVSVVRSRGSSRVVRVTVP
jgi:M6 family metalloprotease-like protein